MDRTLRSISPIDSSSEMKPRVDRARYCMMIFVASVLPAPLSPLMMMDWFDDLPREAPIENK